MILLTLNLLDAVATLTWLQMGMAEEANPFMAYALMHGPLAFLCAKLLVILTAAYVLWNTRSHIYARIGVTFTCVIYAALAGYHAGGGINTLL